MVLDTRLKNFKYSWFSKLLCIVLACVCGVTAVMSFIPLFYRGIITDGAMKFSEKITVYDTSSFRNYVLGDIYTIIGLARANENQKQYEAEKKSCVDDIVAQFTKAKQEYEKTGGKEYTYHEDYTEVSEYTGKYFTHISPVLGTMGWTLDFSINPETAADSVGSSFDESYYSAYHGHFDKARIDALKNVRYYAVASDGTVVSNVDRKESVVNAVFCDYIFVENGKISSYSDSIKSSSLGEPEYLYEFSKTASVYYAINPACTGNDKFQELQKAVNMTNSINYTVCVVGLLLSVIGMIFFLSMSVRLAGHKSDKLTLTFIDKIPCDLHLVLSVFADFWVGFAAVGLVCFKYEQIVGDETWPVLDEITANPQLFIVALSTVVAVFILIIAELLTSFARRIKTKSPVFRYTVIFFLLNAVWKIIKFIGRQFVKLFVKIKKWFEMIIFKPQKLNSSTAILTVAYTVANVVILTLSGFLTCLCIYDGNEAMFFCMSAVFVAVLVGNAYVLYRVFKYMRSLDTIISKAEKHEAFDMRKEEIPMSLQPLVNALDETNTQLQKAVIKAVRDERTKTELITNVSHDLKTPLTSVINYIDLLKQCDITDEKALEYMDVIDEKSIKLKRLIEDLIEASKVSSGNVTVNKTKLNLNELATQAIVEESSELEKRGLKLIFDEPEQKVIVTADGTKIYRVLENLFSNVCKYSAENSRVYASVYSDSGHGYFEIKNISGEPLNISADELTERFVRGDASRNRDGNGLGLSIARDLCTLNDGELIITIDGDLFKATVKLPE